MQAKQTGNYGEQIAVAYLQKKGYQILEQNWFFQKAEVDIICQLEDVLVFVEVKTRTGTQFGLPEQSVGKAKQRALARAADEYIYLHKHTGEIRYDILSVFLQKGKQPDIVHFEDAFFPIL